MQEVNTLILRKLKDNSNGKSIRNWKKKTAVAKVWLENGNGQLTINGQSLDAWLGGHESIKKRVMQPLNVSKQETSVNIVVKTLVVDILHKLMLQDMVFQEH